MLQRDVGLWLVSVSLAQGAWGVTPRGAFHALYSGSFFCKIFKEKSLYYFFIQRSVCHLSLPRFCFPEGIKL